MDIIYNIQQTGTNNILLNETVDKSVPVFTMTFTNPWTFEEKTATIPHDGTDGEWVLTIIGISEAYEDLTGGEIYFSHQGTWEVDVYESGTLIKSINLQIV